MELSVRSGADEDRRSGKALIYLGVAARQQPENPKYARALRDAEAAHHSNRMSLLSIFRRSR